MYYKPFASGRLHYLHYLDFSAHYSYRSGYPFRSNSPLAITRLLKERDVIRRCEFSSLAPIARLVENKLTLDDVELMLNPSVHLRLGAVAHTIILSQLVVAAALGIREVAYLQRDGVDHYRLSSQRMRNPHRTVSFLPCRTSPIFGNHECRLPS